MKLARLATGRPGLVGTHMGYHGMSLGTISVSGLLAWRQVSAEPPVEGTRLVQHGNIEELRQAVDRKHRGRGSGADPVGLRLPRWPTKTISSKLRSIVSRWEPCSFSTRSRPGSVAREPGLLAEHWGVEPDIMCVGKVLSGGCRSGVGDPLHRTGSHGGTGARALFNNSSFGGNPLACSAGVATLEVLKGGLLDQAKATRRSDLARALTSSSKNFQTFWIGHHGMGLMRCLEFAQFRLTGPCLLRICAPKNGSSPPRCLIFRSSSEFRHPMSQKPKTSTSCWRPASG